MNGQLVFDQTSGNNWGSPIRSMLHERVQTGAGKMSASQASIFEDLERQMAEQEAEFAATLGSLIKNFIFNNPEPITAFLRTHRALAPILLESVPYLAECFGSDASFALEIMSDEGPPTAIYALVLWRWDRAVARAALQRFDEHWWMNNLKKAAGRIVFDYELL
jgi:hypothetical protein